MRNPALCTMCSPRGVNVKEMIVCRRCKERYCRHLVRFVDNNRVGLCDFCIAETREEIKK
jgi:hypothetical protein